MGSMPFNNNEMLSLCSEWHMTVRLDGGPGYLHIHQRSWLSLFLLTFIDISLHFRNLQRVDSRIFNNLTMPRRTGPTRLLPSGTENETGVPPCLTSTSIDSGRCGLHFLPDVSKRRISSRCSASHPRFPRKNEPSEPEEDPEDSRCLILCNGGTRSLQTKSRSHNIKHRFFSGEIAKHCTTRRPNLRFLQKFEAADPTNRSPSGHGAKKPRETRGHKAKNEGDQHDVR